MGNIGNMGWNTARRWVQQGWHRNVMSEHRTGTGTGTKLEMGILRVVLVIPKFEHGTKFWESQESVWSCDSGASRVDEFWGGTGAGGVTRCVTGSELANICQQVMWVLWDVTLDHSYLFLRCDRMTEEKVLDSAQIYGTVCVHVDDHTPTLPLKLCVDSSALFALYIQHLHELPVFQAVQAFHK